MAITELGETTNTGGISFEAVKNLSAVQQTQEVSLEVQTYAYDAFDLILDSIEAGAITAKRRLVLASIEAFEEFERARINRQCIKNKPVQGRFVF